MQSITSTAARRAVLDTAIAAGPHSGLVAELVARFVANLETDEQCEVTGNLAPIASYGADPRSDHELLAALVAAGPHGEPVDALVRAHAAWLAEFDRVPEAS